MINALLKGVFSLVMGLIGIILTPIDMIISTALPDVANIMDMFNGFIDYIIPYFSWAVSWLGLSSEIIAMIIAYYTFILTAPLLVSTVKLAIKWYDKLKL